MAYEIEKNIERPMSHTGAKVKYPYREMEVGDSFYLDTLKKGESAVRAANMWARHSANERKFSGRTDGTGYRIWRIK